MIRTEASSDVFWVAPEGEGGVGGAAGMKKAGTQTIVFWEYVSSVSFWDPLMLSSKTHNDTKIKNSVRNVT